MRVFIAVLVITISNAVMSQTGPAGTTNCVLWLKADAGTNNGGVFVPTTGLLDEWQDQSGNGNHTTSATSSPFKVQNNSSPERRMNYNPVVLFDQSTDQFLGPNLGMNGATSLSEFYVFQSAPAPAPVVNYLAIFSLGYDVTGPQNSAHRFENDPFSGSYMIFDDNWAGHLAAASSSDSYYSQSIKSSVYNGANFIGYANGTQTSNLATGTGINGIGGYRIGDCEPAGVQSSFGAGEVLIFNTALNNNQRRRVNSYLAIKYGITLSHGYRRTNNAVIYPLVGGFDNDVIGLGRMDNSGLYQRQSHTLDDMIRIYLNTLQTTNAGNSGTIANDESFVVIGDNGGQLNSTAASNAEMPAGCGLYSRLEREWRVRRSDFSETFNLDISLSATAAPGSVNPNELRFLVDTDDDFSNGGTTCYFNGDGSGITITYNNPVITVSGLTTSHIALNAIRYFTIGSILKSTPLPVEFLALNSECKNTGVELNWQTTTETRNDYFTLDRSADGNIFETIAIIDGAGTITSQSDYRFVDQNPIEGIAYYRLSQTDEDGAKQELSIIVSECKRNSYSIYPNPFENRIYINSPEAGMAYLTDVSGKIVMEKQLVTGKNIIETQDLAAGAYFVKLMAQNGEVLINKLVKQ